MMLVLWSVPRGRSTAFFRMMLERGDFTVVHEPFSYLKVFGYADVCGQRFTSEEDFIAAARQLAAQNPIFIKETTSKCFTEVLGNRQFLGKDAQHTFLIRHPCESIASYFSIRPDVELQKIGFGRQYEIFTNVVRLTGSEPVVVHSDDLVSRPIETVKAYCAAVGIDFIPEALSWTPGDRPEWEMSKSWHIDVAATTGFSKVNEWYAADIERHPIMRKYLEYHLPFYERLAALRLPV